MSALPENELDLDKLFLPAWAQEPASAKHYAHYEGVEDKPDRKDSRRGRKGPRREGPPGDRPREGHPRGDRGDRDERGDRGDRPRRVGDRRPFDRGRPGGAPRLEPRERREPPPPLPEIDTAFVPDEKGVESLARQIRTTGRAYPLFDIARLILQKPERYTVTFGVRKKPEGGQAVQPLFLCALDDTLWLGEDEAVTHVLRNHFGTFYQTERTATEPPKGKYTFVAQCGISGVILGPPNYHDYQNQLRKLHAERFSRMPFEAFKARVKIVRDEEIVKKWIDDQSWLTEYVCLNMPEPLRLGSREAVEKHFRETHKDNIIKPVETYTLTGTAARSLRCHELARLVRQSWEDQRRFPLQIATVLSQQFAGHGLQFFKVNKSITHVSVARPHYLDLETTPVSDGVKRIVDFINTHPKCTRRHLVETLTPSPAPTPVPLSAAPPPAEPAAAAPVEPEGSRPPPATPPAGAAPAPAESPAPTPEQTAVIADLHWLVHQGHVIEFANGILETAKKPAPRPPRPEKPAAPPSDAAPAGTPPAPETGQASETPPAAEAVVETSQLSELAPTPPPIEGASATPETPAPEESKPEPPPAPTDG